LASFLRLDLLLLKMLHGCQLFSELDQRLVKRISLISINIIRHWLTYNNLVAVCLMFFVSRLLNIVFGWWHGLTLLVYDKLLMLLLFFSLLILYFLLHLCLCLKVLHNFINFKLFTLTRNLRNFVFIFTLTWICPPIWVWIVHCWII
jgi:hypothetical protein